MTADILTEKGAFEGKLFAKINGNSFDVPVYLVPDLEKLAPGDEVGYKEYNNILTKIWKKRKQEKQTYITIPPNGNGNGKNQKLITFLALHRDAVQMFQTTTVPDTETFKDAMDAVYDRAVADLERAYKDFGEVSG